MQDEQASQRRPATGENRVDEALAKLDELAGLPVTEHPAVFEQVHGGLTAALGTLDSGTPGISGASGTRGTSDPSITPGS